MLALINVIKLEEMNILQLKDSCKDLGNDIYLAKESYLEFSTFHVTEDTINGCKLGDRMNRLLISFQKSKFSHILVTDFGSIKDSDILRNPLITSVPRVTYLYHEKGLSYCILPIPLMIDKKISYFPTAETFYDLNKFLNLKIMMVGITEIDMIGNPILNSLAYPTLDEDNEFNNFKVYLDCNLTALNVKVIYLLQKSGSFEIVNSKTHRKYLNSLRSEYESTPSGIVYAFGMLNKMQIIHRTSPDYGVPEVIIANKYYPVLRIVTLREFKRFNQPMKLYRMISESNEELKYLRDVIKDLHFNPSNKLDQDILDTKIYILGKWA